MNMFLAKPRPIPLPLPSVQSRMLSLVKEVILRLWKFCSHFLVELPLTSACLRPMLSLVQGIFRPGTSPYRSRLLESPQEPPPQEPPGEPLRNPQETPGPPQGRRGSQLS